MYSSSQTMINLTSSTKYQVAGIKTINKQPNINFIQFKKKSEIATNSSCGTPGMKIKSKNHPFVIHVNFVAQYLVIFLEKFWC